MEQKVKARVVKTQQGASRVECQRGKRKWWFEFGKHKETDTAFEQALAMGAVEWLPKIKDETKLF